MGYIICGVAFSLWFLGDHGGTPCAVLFLAGILLICLSDIGGSLDNIERRLRK